MVGCSPDAATENGVLTASQLLGLLQDDPDHETAIRDLREAFESQDASRLGDDPLVLLRAAREQHEAHGEHRVAAALLAIEAERSTDPDERAALLVKLARIEADELLDDAAAKRSYQAAREARPGDDSVREAIDAIDATESNWKEIAKRFVDEADEAREASLRTSLLVSAGSLVWKYKKRGRDKDVDRLFGGALEAEPGSPRATRLYATILRAREKWDELATLYIESAEKTRDQADQSSFFLAAARIIARKLQQPERAAACYERVLSLTPDHAEAMAFLVEHFTVREKWDDLVMLYDEALRTKLRPDAEQGILLQLGMVHWRFRNAPKEAEPYFARLRKLDPLHPGMLGFYREFLIASGDQQRLFGILADAQRQVSDPRQKLDLAIETARAASESGASDRAIEAWKAVQRLDAHNRDAAKALADLYRESGKWNALVEVWKSEVEALPADAVDAKVRILRDMVAVYREHLRMDVMVINTWNAVLALRPDDGEALEALAATYEHVGRWNDLIQVLTRKADGTEDKEVRVALYMRVARLWIDRFANYNQASRPLEQVIELQPSHREALSLLKDIYGKRRAWKQLFDVLRVEAQLASDPDVRQAHRLELARLATEKLHKPAEAIPLWRDVLQSDESSTEALDALEKLAEREKDWATLSDVLERRSLAAGDDKENIKILTKLGTLYAEQVNDPKKASETWRRVLALDPKNGRAMRTLRESYVSAGAWDELESLYGETNDWDGLAEVFGNAADKAADTEGKVSLSFRAAEVYEKRINEPHRAFRAYERVLAADPRNERAVRALVPLYERDEKWSRLPALLDVLLDRAAADGSPLADRLALLEKARRIALEKLSDADMALRYALAAYALAPAENSTRDPLETCAERANALETLVATYEARLAAIPTPNEERAWLQRRIGKLASTRLHDLDRALRAHRARVADAPDDVETQTQIETMLRGASRFGELRDHLAARLDRAGEEIERWALIQDLAKVEEEHLSNKDRAAELYRQALEIDAGDVDTLRAVERLAREGGRHAEVATSLETLRGLVPEGERLGVALALAGVYSTHLGRRSDAVDVVAEVLAESTSEPRAIAMLESIAEEDAELAPRIRKVLEPAYAAVGDADKLRAVLRAELAAATTPEAKRTLRSRLAEVALSAGAADEAYDALEAAFLDEPTDAELWDRLAAAADRAGKHESLAAACATVLDAGELGERDQAGLAERLARTYDVVIGRPDLAEPYHKKVLALEPGHETSFIALKQLYTDQERWGELQQLYRAKIESTESPADKLELLLQLCFVFEELVDDPTQAIEVYRGILAIEPGHTSSRRALDRLYVRTEKHAELVELLRGDLTSVSDAEVPALLVRIGGLLETKLGDPSGAVDAYEDALQRDPTVDGARDSLERLLSVASVRQRVATILEPYYEARESWPELVRTLEIQLESKTDVADRVLFLDRLADLRGNQLRDAKGAFDALARAVELAPEEHELRERLARVAAERGSHAERAEVIERALNGVKENATLELELVSELAAIYDQELSDFEKAEPWYEHVLEAAADDADRRREAALALERIHLAKDDAPKLARDLRVQADLEDDSQKKGQLLVRLADIAESRLEDLERAAAIHRERVELDPSSVDALRSLERIEERRGDGARLASVLEQLDGALESDDERREVVLKLANVVEQKLSDSNRAVDVYSDALARFGPSRAVLEPLARLYEAAGRHEDLAETIESLRAIADGDEERAVFAFRGGEIQRKHLSNAERAVGMYAEALDLSMHHEGATASLRELLAHDDLGVRLAAARVLRPRDEARSETTPLMGVLGVLAESDDPAEKLEALRRGAEVLETQASQPADAFAFASRALRVGVGEPDVGVLLDEVDRLSVPSGAFADYAQLLRDIAPELSDGDLQVRALRRLAALERDRLRDPVAARGTYERLLELQPDDREALDALEQLVTQADDGAALVDVLRRKVDVATGSDRLPLMLRQATVLEEKLADRRGAIDVLDQVLAEGEAREAYVALERLYGAEKRWPELASLYDRMLEKKVGAAVEVRHRLGRLYREHLSDPHAAIEQFREALASGAPHEPTIEQLEELMQTEEHRASAAAILEPVYLSRLAWTKVQTALEARLSGESDLEQRKALFQRLGELHEDYLEDLDGAFSSYARMFREDPRDRSVWDTLSRLAKVLETWGRLATTYRGALDDVGVDDADTAKLAMTAGELFEQRANDPASAVDLYGRVLRFDPTDRAAFTALERLHTQGKDWTSLLSLYRDQADVAPDDATRLTLLEKSAVVERDERHDQDAAIDRYREMLDVDPKHAGATDALDALYEARERFQDLADHLRHRIEHTDELEQQLDLKFRLGELLGGRLDDVDGAIDLFEEITQASPEHTRAIAALERWVVNPERQARIIQILEPIYEITDQWKKRIAVYEAQAEMTVEPSDKVRLLSDVARLHETRGNDPALAFSAYARALATDPGDDGVRSEVDRLATVLDDWNGLVSAYEAAIQASADPVITTALLSTVARVHDEKRGDPRAAIETYERILQNDTEDASPLEALEALHTMIGDWRGMVNVLERKVERVYDPVERAELLRRAGSVAEDLLGDRAVAVGLYKRASEEDSNDVVAFESLDRIYSEGGNPNDLAQVLERRLELETDAEIRGDVALRLGQLADEQLRDADLAVRAYQQALEALPDDATALSALGRLLERQGNYADLLENLRTRAAVAPNDAERVALLHRAAEVLERELDDVPEAIRTLESVLAIDSRHEQTLGALMRIAKLEEHGTAASELVLPFLEAQQRWDDVASVLALSAEASSDPVEKRSRFARLAQVHEDGRGDKAAAFDAIRRAFAEDPGEPGLADELERLGGDLGAFDRVADALAARGSTASDPSVGFDLYTRLAKIAETHLNDDTRAIEALRRALEQVGDDATTLASLDRLFTKTGAIRDLLEVVERRARVENDPRARNSLALRAGALRAEHLGDARGALTAFQEVLDADPANEDARSALEGMLSKAEVAADAVDILDRAYESTGDAAKRARLYDARIRLAGSDGERVTLWSELADLREQSLGDAKGALDAKVQAFALEPSDESLATELERLAAMAGDWSSLDGLVERVVAGGSLGGSARRDLQHRAAGWYRDHLGQPAKAETALRAALVEDGEMREAHEDLIALLRSGGRERELVDAMAAYSAVDSDGQAARDRFMEAASIAEGPVGDAARAAELYGRVLQGDPNDTQAIDRLLAIKTRAGAHDEVVELLERRIDLENEPEARLSLRRTLAAALEAHPSGSRDRVIDSYRAILDEVPTDLATIGKLEDLFEAAGRLRDLEEMVERRLELAENDAERTNGRVRLARLYDRQGKTDESLSILREVLADQPDHDDAGNELAKILERSGDVRGLADLLAERAERRQVAGDDAGVVSILTQLAALEDEKLGDKSRAIETYRRIVALRPSDIDAWRAVARLARAEGRTADAADALDRIVALEAPADAIATALELAALAEGPLADDARAEGALKAAVGAEAAAGVSPRAARTALISFYEKRKQHHAYAALVAEETEELADVKAKVASYKRLADLFAKDVGDASAAASYLEKAVALDPEDRTALLPLCDLYIAAGRQGDAVPVLEKIIASYGTRRTKEVAVYQHRLGQALEGMGNVQGALTAYDAAFKIDLTSVPILRDLGKLCYTTGDYDRANKTFRALQLQKLDGSAGITKGDVYYYLADISVKQGDPKKAIGMLERAVVEHPGHADATRLLAELKG